MENEGKFTLEIDPYELGFDLAKGIIPVLKAFAEQGGTMTAYGDGTTKPVMIGGDNTPDANVLKAIRAFELVNKVGAGVGGLTPSETKEMEEGIRLFADNITGLWI